MRKLPRILVVEDEPSIAELIAVNRPLAASRHLVFDGAAAQRGGRGVADVILLDWMPGESGAVLARWRRTNAPRPSSSLLTARSDRRQGAGPGRRYDDYIANLSPRRSCSRIARCCAAARRIVNDSVQVSELTLGAATYRVSFRGRELKVGPTEFRLLHYLMSAELCTPWYAARQGLGDHVFIERTVDVHVKRLRESLGEASTMIETVRGAGYRLTAMSGPARRPARRSRRHEPARPPARARTTAPARP